MINITSMSKAICHFIPPSLFRVAKWNAAILTITSFLLSACQTPPLDVSYSMDDKVDFSQFETFSINSTSTSNDALIGTLTRNIATVISEKGYRKVSKEDADLAVVYFVDIERDTKLKQSPIPIKGNIYMRATLETVNEAKILVNIFDTKTKAVLWKASSYRDLTNVDTSRIDEQKVYARMLELFESFPSE